MEQQIDLGALFPGAPGGRALAGRRGRAYFIELGRRGGCKTRDLYGVAHLRTLAQKGAAEKRRRLHTWPATITSWDGETYRRVPYWPARRSSRRRRPVFVRIELQRSEGGAL